MQTANQNITPWEDYIIILDARGGATEFVSRACSLISSVDTFYKYLKIINWEILVLVWSLKSSDFKLGSCMPEEVEWVLLLIFKVG